MAPDRETYRQVSTEELRKRLAQWVGFKWDPSMNSWIDPNGNRGNPPDFVESLDSCFTWLMPRIKLIRIDYIGSGIWPNGEITEWQVGIVSHAKPKIDQVYGFAKSPSEALCRAIYNLILDQDGKRHNRVAID